MIPEDALSRECCGLSAVANAELGIEMPKVSLDRVLADVEALPELTVGQARRKQGQEFAFPFSQSDVPAGPAKCFIELGVLGSLGQYNAGSASGGFDASMICSRCDALEMKARRASTKCTSDSLGMVRKTEHHNGSVSGSEPSERTLSVRLSELPIRVEQRDIRLASGRLRTSISTTWISGSLDRSRDRSPSRTIM